jgi:hypothetical protein
MTSFSEYLEARERNRTAFSQGHASVATAFDVSIHAFDLLGEQLRDGRDANGMTHISLAPFFFILQRQAIAAFDALSTNQAYSAWLLVRPGVEAALILAKWVEDKGNADIWSRRAQDKKAYRKAFEGKALVSTVLPRSNDIQAALSAINDRFLHPNPTYYHRHLELNDLPDGNVELRYNFFDDSLDVAIGILGILHLVVVIQDSLAQMFATLFPGTSRLEVGLLSLETRAGDWARETMARSTAAATDLKDLGLWAPQSAG